MDRSATHRLVVLAFAAALTIACSGSSPRTGTICSNGNSCPTGQACVQGVCVSLTAFDDATVDADSTSDATTGTEGPSDVVLADQGDQPGGIDIAADLSVDLLPPKDGAASDTTDTSAPADQQGADVAADGASDQVSGDQLGDGQDLTPGPDSNDVADDLSSDGGPDSADTTTDTSDTTPSCNPGFHLELGQCVSNTGQSQCTPTNPANGSDNLVTVTETWDVINEIWITPICPVNCNQDFQDNDGNSTCMPTCASVTCGAYQRCDDASGMAVCFYHSCLAVKDAGNSVDGVFPIDPDGNGPAKPRWMYCDLQSGTAHDYGLGRYDQHQDWTLVDHTLLASGLVQQQLRDVYNANGGLNNLDKGWSTDQCCFKDSLDAQNHDALALDGMALQPLRDGQLTCGQSFDGDPISFGLSGVGPLTAPLANDVFSSRTVGTSSSCGTNWSMAPALFTKGYVGAWLASCKAIYDAGLGPVDGLYWIDENGPRRVYCDMTQGGAEYEYGIGRHDLSPGAGWKVMNLAAILTHQAALIAFYNAHNGMPNLSYQQWGTSGTFNSCMKATETTDNTMLLSNTGYFKMFKVGGADISGGLVANINDDQFIWFGTHSGLAATPPVDDNFFVTVGATEGTSCGTSKNPAFWMKVKLPNALAALEILAQSE